MQESLRIVDPETGRPVVREGQAGEIWVSSGSVGRGCFADPAATAATFQARLDPDDGRRYLRTGDLGTIRGGWLTVTGRFKEVLIANGSNIPAPDLEWWAAALDDRLNPLAAAAYHEEGEDHGEATLLIES